MTVQDAISRAEANLPGHAAPEGETDPRWQAVIAVAEFVETESEAVWSFVVRWGCSSDADLRMAIATCVLEHLLEHHFDAFISRVEEVARANRFFAGTVKSCWKAGQSEEPSHAGRLERLVASLRDETG